MLFFVILQFIAGLLVVLNESAASFHKTFMQQYYLHFY